MIHRRLELRLSDLIYLDGLLDDNQRAEHINYGPELNFNKAKAAGTDAQQRPGFKRTAEQQTLI